MAKAKHYQNIPKLTLYQCISPKNARTELWGLGIMTYKMIDVKK